MSSFNGGTNGGPDKKVKAASSKPSVKEEDVQSTGDGIYSDVESPSASDNEGQSDKDAAVHTSNIKQEHNEDEIQFAKECARKSEQDEKKRSRAGDTEDGASVNSTEEDQKARKKKRKKSKKKKRNKIKEPNDFDVLLGRGKPYQAHPGNRRMLVFVNEHKEKYMSLKRDMRHAYADTVLDKILEGDVRFLKKRDEEYWFAVDRSVAFEKISHALRNKRERKCDQPTAQTAFVEPAASLHPTITEGGVRLGSYVDHSLPLPKQNPTPEPPTSSSIPVAMRNADTVYPSASYAALGGLGRSTYPHAASATSGIPGTVRERLLAGLAPTSSPAETSLSQMRSLMPESSYLHGASALRAGQAAPSLTPGLSSFGSVYDQLLFRRMVEDEALQMLAQRDQQSMVLATERRIAEQRMLRAQQQYLQNPVVPRAATDLTSPRRANGKGTSPYGKSHADAFGR